MSVKENNKFDKLTNEEFVIAMSEYSKKWFDTVITNWETVVNSVAEKAIALVKEFGDKRYMLECHQVSCGNKNCSAPCSEAFKTTIMGIYGWKTGEIQKILNIPDDEYDFEKLFIWQTFSLEVILDPLYEDVYKKVKKLLEREAVEV
jgi:hypothetical protein